MNARGHPTGVDPAQAPAPPPGKAGGVAAHDPGARRLDGAARRRLRPGGAPPVAATATRRRRRPPIPPAEPTWRHITYTLHGTDGRLKPPGSASAAPAPAAPPPIPGGTGRLPGGRPRGQLVDVVGDERAADRAERGARRGADPEGAVGGGGAREGEAVERLHEEFPAGEGQGGGFVFGKGGGW